MKKQYTLDIINSDDFLGDYKIELVELAVQDYAFKYIVIVRDPITLRVEFVRDLPSFRPARAFYNYVRENEGMVKDVSDLYSLFQEFTKKE